MGECLGLSEKHVQSPGRIFLFTIKGCYEGFFGRMNGKKVGEEKS